VSRSVTSGFAIRTAALLTAAWAAGACCGCRSQPEANTVSGTVRFNDKVLTYGSIAFHYDSGRPFKVVIRTDGSYTISNPPLGKVKVVVSTGPPPIAIAAPGGNKGGELSKFEKIDIPAHYSDPEKTDLRYTVTPGQNRFDVNLKPDPNP
jgi:hypothetical protein